MPIYEYQCDGCGYQFEVKQSIKDEALTTCERCGKSLRRLISSPGIMFKGSGWYVTDYSNKMKPPSEGEKAPAGDKKEASAGSTSTPASSPASSPAPAAGDTSNSTPAATPSTTKTSNT